MRRLALGVFVGGLVYSAVVFPLVLVFGFHGDVWSGVCMLFGCACGAAGVLWSLTE